MTKDFPEHIAVILDGNGRWAQQHGLPRALGHKAGCDNLEVLVEEMSDMGVRYFTVYAFSTENWKRSEAEVSALMEFFLYYIRKLRDKAMVHNIRVNMIGDRSAFSPELQEALDTAIRDSAANTGMTFTMALNYGSRDEIVRGIRKLARDVKAGELAEEEITEERFSGYLDTAGMPDPDLLIRTSGEQRLSNYLLWQLAYAEMVFMDVLWPDFGHEHLEKAIEEYRGRSRRFGGRAEEGAEL